MYENVSTVCVPTANKKEQDLDPGRPALYVGRPVGGGWKRAGSTGVTIEDSHIYKHQLIAHKGEPAKFVTCVVGSQKTALAR